MARPATELQNRCRQPFRTLAMRSQRQPTRFWINWLLLVSAGVAAFGLLLVFAPALTRQGFSLLFYASREHIDAFGPESARYIALVHAVLGGVMIGWGAALFYVTREFFARGSAIAWKLIAISVGAWFVPDTSYSLLFGFWQNAILNAVFLILFAVPLLATRTALHEDT